MKLFYEMMISKCFPQAMPGKTQRKEQLPYFILFSK